VFVLETLSTAKLADLLQRNLAGTERTLRVYLQVNTSGEDSKSGVDPLTSADAAAPLAVLARHVRDKCPNLVVAGLMTIGSWEASHAPGQNPDFKCLKANRTLLAQVLGVPESDLELSMGMSADFAEAIKEGSSGVRVGTRIFGARPKKQ
jgi:pyridoxal phosphate enzyme (YggS family)